MKEVLVRLTIAVIGEIVEGCRVKWWPDKFNKTFRMFVLNIVELQDKTETSKDETETSKDEIESSKDETETSKDKTEISKDETDT